jgi:type IV pilus assembly protein PilC
VSLFKYIAKDQAGRSVTATMQAENERVVVAALKKRGLVVLNVSEELNSSAVTKKGKRKVKGADLVVFVRQLATMVDAGLPLLQALQTLADQTENPSLKIILEDVVGSIEQGATFSESLSAHPRVFTSLFVNMVRAGEASGTLAEILERIAGYMEASLALKRKVKSAMIYPIIVCSMAIIITSVLILKVIPVFGDIYEGFGSALPLPTQMLLDFSDFMRAYFLFAIGGIVVGVIALKKYVKTASGALRFDKFKFNVPVFGPIFRKVAVSRFSRTLSVLVRSGVPILSALDIVSKTSGNKLVERAVDGAMEEIKRGENIAEPLAASEVFPPMVTKMIAVGEESGKLEVMLSKIADFYDSQVDAAVSGLTSLIEPLMIAFLGIVIGGIVICMFLPIFKLSEVVSM